MTAAHRKPANFLHSLTFALGFASLSAACRQSSPAPESAPNAPGTQATQRTPVLGAESAAGRGSPTEAAPAAPVEPLGAGAHFIGPVGKKARLIIPAVGTRPLPLVLALHGYGGHPDEVDRRLGVSRTGEVAGYISLLPPGAVDHQRRGFWNASDACCDFDGIGPKHVEYLVGLVNEAKRVAPVDASRIFVVGASNGGFMGYRLACEHPEIFRAVASIGGSDALAEPVCQTGAAVSVLQIHGDADRIIPIGGGTIGEVPRAFPAAAEVVLRWARRAGCGAETPASATLDLTRAAGDETQELRYSGCRDGANVRLWTVPGGAHWPEFNPEAMMTIWQALSAS